MHWCSKLRHCVPQLVRLHGGCLDSSWDGGVHHSSQRKPMPVLQPKFPTSAYSPKLVEETVWKILGGHSGDVRSSPWRAENMPRICPTKNGVTSARIFLGPKRARTPQHPRFA